MTKLNKSVAALIISIAAIVIFILVSSKLPSVLVFIPAVIIAFAIYVNNFLEKSPDPKRTLSLYLFLIGIQLLHFTEEYLTDFTTRLPELFGQEVYPMEVWVTFNMVAYFVFVLGGIIIFKGMNELLIIPIFFVLAGVLLNSIAHVILSIYVGGYFPGLYTALVYMVVGPVFIKRVFSKEDAGRS